LIIAANKGHHQIVSSLLAKQADVTAATNDGLTALMTASYKVRSRTRPSRARKECTSLTLACAGLVVVAAGP
jgi:ankyrin repeat protein